MTGSWSGKLLRISAAAALPALLLCGLACSAGRADAPQPGPVRTDLTDLTVRRGRFEDRFLLTGQLVAINADNLFVPRIPSWQTTIRWLEEEGAVVQKGQKLVEFDTAAFAQDYGEKSLASDQAESDHTQALADQAGQKAEKLFQVDQKAIAVEKAKIAAAIPAEFIRGKDYQDNQLALTRAMTELAKAQEDLAAFDASSAETIRQKQITLEKSHRELSASEQAMDGMVLTAPRDGILVVADHPWQGHKLQVGDTVWVFVGRGRQNTMKREIFLSLVGLAGAFALPMVRGAETPAPTWAREVAPILYRNCVECHRLDGVAPFSLLTFSDAAKRGACLKSV